MPPRDIDELGIAPRRPDRYHVAEREDHDARDPQPQAKPDRGGQRRIGDREPARCAAKQDMLGQRAVNRDDKARHSFGRSSVHQTSAPPPNEKNDRKKDDAVKAIDRPKTIWIIRRAPPGAGLPG